MKAVKILNFRVRQERIQRGQAMQTDDRRAS
jgi:hypothetical protein